MTQSTSKAKIPHSNRTILLLLSVGAMIVAMMGLGTGGASAAVAPQSSGATCGWYSQHVATNSPFYWKITSTGLPKVTGTTSTPMLVTLKVDFMHSSDQYYRTGNFYTYASAGKWTTSWTSYSNRTTGWTSLQDSNGESGYVGAELKSPDTFVHFHISWLNGAYAATNQLDQWAYSPLSLINHNVCNGGANFA